MTPETDPKIIAAKLCEFARTNFVAEGVGPETLARLVREEAVVRPARGLYQGV